MLVKVESDNHLSLRDIQFILRIFL